MWECIVMLAVIKQIIPIERAEFASPSLVHHAATIECIYIHWPPIHWRPWLIRHFCTEQEKAKLGEDICFNNIIPFCHLFYVWQEIGFKCIILGVQGIDKGRHSSSWMAPQQFICVQSRRCWPPLAGLVPGLSCPLSSLNTRDKDTSSSTLSQQHIDITKCMTLFVIVALRRYAW